MCVSGFGTFAPHLQFTSSQVVRWKITADDDVFFGGGDGDRDPGY